MGDTMSKKPIESFYDQKYTDYQHPAPSTWLEKAYHLLKKYELHRNDAAILLLQPGKAILDIGAGSGDLLYKASRKGYSQVFGIDISKVVVKQGQQYLKKHGISADISQQNIDEGLTFKDRQFDAVTMIAVFEHIFDPHRVLHEINRVLKKGGQLIIEVPNVVFLPRRVAFLQGRLPKTADEPNYIDGHLQFFTQDSLEQLLVAHGFKVVHRGSSGIFWRFRDVWPELLGANILVKAIKR